MTLLNNDNNKQRWQRLFLLGLVRDVWVKKITLLPRTLRFRTQKFHCTVFFYVRVFADVFSCDIQLLWYACMLSHFSHVWLFVTLWTVASQVPLSSGSSRQEYWSRLPCPPPGVFPTQRPHLLCLLHWQMGSRGMEGLFQGLIHIHSNPRWPCPLKKPQLQLPTGSYFSIGSEPLKL